MTINLAPKTPAKKAQAAADRQADRAVAKIVGKGDGDKSVVNMRMDNDLLARIDAAAKRMGIGRTAWLHVAANRMLDGA